MGRSLGGALGARLMQAATELRLGVEPAEVWGHLGALPGGARLARCLARSGEAGAPVAEAVNRLAVQLRAAQTRRALVRARRAGVLVTGPLGLCFLPAFVALGIVPVVLGLVRTLA